MSARAAWRLESLGFSRIYRYVSGKADWAASGLPIEGKQVTAARAGTLARRDVPTCHLADRLGDVQARVRAAGQNECVVVNDKGIVLGRLGRSAWEADPETVAETVMESGPTTLRPNTSREAILRRMQKGKTDSLLVTTSDGDLMGILNRSDVEEREVT
ncbi:MAG TPA: CBS domain-containing protein [Candidatus Binatia bacterium]|nr:CBS domain-containing protein [Candidatus Binatia bacterium]